MTGRPSAERILHERPTSLVGSDDSSLADMRDAFADGVSQVIEHNESGAETVAVQGPISSMKTWLLTCTAEEFTSRRTKITALVPQKTNRRNLVGRLEQFDVPYVERPARLDLCAWDEWRESVGRVDERICSTNGCHLYPDNQDMEEVARRALSFYKLHYGSPVKLDEQRVRTIASAFGVCPHYLREALGDLDKIENTVEVATYAKALKTDDWPSSDVVLLDESHTVAASGDPLTKRVDLPAITAAVADVYERSQNTVRKRVIDARRDLNLFVDALQIWEESSEVRAVTPDELFDGTDARLSSAFEALETIREMFMAKLNRAVDSGDSERIELTRQTDNQLRDVVDLLAQIQGHREGKLDFVHTRYEARGEEVNEMAFRQVAGCESTIAPGDIYEAWRENGTHPAIEERWGGLLDHHIEQVWEGRHVEPGGDRDTPGVPIKTFERLRSTTGADTLVGYSATHNELSDPARSPGDLRETTHQLVAAPLQLRSDGDDRRDYHGRTSVDAATPWFRRLVEQAKNETGAQLAAVPINSHNEAKWAGMPVEPLDLAGHQGITEDHVGLVPHSRGAIGRKELERLAVDAVLCGVQVQAPTDTARRLVSLWEVLAPDHDDPAEALQRGWRLLAQHAISGTIQAAGRFRADATNIVFERPELIELAGFECKVLSSSMDGFPGVLARKIDQIQSEHQRRNASLRAAKVVRNLEHAESKTPTRAQFLSKFRETYDATEEDANEAAMAALEDGRIEYTAGMLRVKAGGESGPEEG